MKKCGYCKKEKEISEFGKSNQTLDGLRWECRQCRKEIYYKNHKKMLEEKRRDYKKHRESRLLKDKEKYINNKEHIKQQRKEHYWSNREKVLEQQKRYKENNREEFLRNRREREQRQRDEIKLEQEILKSQQITVNYPPNYKICSKCKTLKHQENYNKKRGFCKECESSSNKKYLLENGDAIRARQRQYHKDNPEIVKATAKRHRQSEAFKIRHALPENRINRNMHQYIKFALNEVGLKKDGRATMKYVGCTRQFFRDYIQSQFQPGMTWENYGNRKDNWSVDHYLPKEAFNILNQEEQDTCFNWKNCRPMWHLEN